MKTAFIFGLGYVGVPLAHALAKKGWQIRGTTRTPSKLICKIGVDWDILNNLMFTLKSNVRFNRIKGNENDGIDNDNDGKVDGKSEIWSTSNSGTVISLNYRF